MGITSITHAIKIVKDNDRTVHDMYIAFGDNIKITDIKGRIFIGTFLYMDLAKYAEEDDLIVLNIGNKNVRVQCSWIEDIEEVWWKIKLCYKHKAFG